MLPRSVAGIALRSARGHLVRLARRELREALSAGDWLGAAVIGLGALWVAPVETLLQQWEATAPPSLPSRAPARASRVGSRRPRIILISEFLPTSEAWGTIGVFQRWSCNIETLLEIGEVDSVFLLREDHSPEDEARLRRVWPTLRYVRMLRVPGRLRYLQILPTVSRALCGSVSCTNGWPDPRIAAPSVATGIAAALRELQPDLVFAHRLGGCATLAALRTPIPPIVTDFDDIEHLKYQRFAQARGRYGPRQRLAAALVRHAERLALRRSRLSLACSEADARRLSELSPGSYIEVLENTAQPGSESPLPQMPRAMFIGVAHYPPNARAVAWLCRDIWPHVRVTMPDAQLVIVGLGTVELGVADPALGIETCGYVHDLEAVYRSSRVALCPVQEGSGTRIKLIEAALRGRPAVSTTVGAEGLAFRPGREILIADRTADFAAACIELLQPGNGRAEDVGRAAWRRACKTYDRDRRRRKLFQLVMQGLRPDVGVDAPETPRPGS